jgi:cytochrome c peroxidase
MSVLVARLGLAGLTASLTLAACSDDVRPNLPGAGGRDSTGGARDGGAPSAGTAQLGAAGAHDSAGEGGVAGGRADAGAPAGAAGSGTIDGRVVYPAYGPSPYPTENPDSDAKALLGKILFWDEQLGGDDTVACGTCHRPNAGGSDPRSATASAALPGPDEMLDTHDDVHGSLGLVRCDAQGAPTGVSVQVTSRKAPTYLDAMFATRLFWDGRAECRTPGCPSSSAFEDPDHPGTFPITTRGALENQAVGPPLSPVEMACEAASWAAIHADLATATPLALAKQIPAALTSFIAENEASYPKLFAAAFGDEQTSGPADEINTRRIAFAIATHERRLLSNQTPWDRWNAGEAEALTPAQVRGWELHRVHCDSCHRAPIFSDSDFHFIGFHRPSWDPGRKAIDPEFGVAGAMRTPTLRNVGLREATGLLHNGAGVGASLAAIIELYDQGGLVDDPEIAAVPISPSILPLNLTQDEKADLLDFLQHGLEDPRVGAQLAPFDRPLLSSE